MTKADKRRVKQANESLADAQGLLQLRGPQRAIVHAMDALKDRSRTLESRTWNKAIGALGNTLIQCVVEEEWVG